MVEHRPRKTEPAMKSRSRASSCQLEIDGREALLDVDVS
jgi:hypothetical protein